MDKAWNAETSTDAAQVGAVVCHTMTIRAGNGSFLLPITTDRLLLPLHPFLPLKRVMLREKEGNHE